MTTLHEATVAPVRDQQPPEVRRVDDVTRTERKVHVWLTPMGPWPVPEEFAVQHGIYIRPDLLTAVIVDGALTTVSLSGKMCTRDGEPKPYKRPAPGSRYPTTRQQDYFVWDGKPTTTSAPSWVRELLTEHGVMLP